MALRFTYPFNSLHAGYFFMLLLSSADFLQNQPFQKILSGPLSECHTVWIQIRTDVDVLSVLIWVQTVCKGYQQTTNFKNDTSREIVKNMIAN